MPFFFMPEFKIVLVLNIIANYNILKKRCNEKPFIGSYI